MAMTINSSPILTGESAMAFVEEAERNGKLPREDQLREIEKRSRDFYQRLFGKLHG